jgi:FeS assembly SUF system protein
MSADQNTGRKAEQNTGDKPARTLDPVERKVIEAQIVEELHGCFDPEIPVNIYELGLVYGVDVAEDGSVQIRMTLTSPHCPAAQSLPPDVAARAKKVKGVTNVAVDVVWEPPWNPGMMTEAAKLQLGMM